VKIRLHGTEGECREADGRLAAVLEVLAVSEPYPDRGASVLVRVYVDAQVAPPAHVTSTSGGGRAAAAGPSRREVPDDWPGALRPSRELRQAVL
jgi:hypothetical protein